MKSVGEVMALGRTFHESFGKALRSLETGRTGWVDDVPAAAPKPDALRVPRPERLVAVLDALRSGMSVAAVYEATGIDPWFLDRFVEVIAVENEVRAAGKKALSTRPSSSRRSATASRTRTSAA